MAGGGREILHARGEVLRLLGEGLNQNGGAEGHDPNGLPSRDASTAAIHVTRPSFRTLLTLFLLAPLGCAQSPTAGPRPGPSAQAEQRAPAEPKPELAPATEPRPRADPEEALPPVAEQWATAFSKGDLDALMKLYDEDALMWGTSSSGIRKGANAIRQYYAQLLKAFPGTRVALQATNPRRYGDTGVNSGAFTMRRTASDGRVVVTSARFTMTYVSRGGRWLIVDHHSSLAPR